jgi:hypothetical protein
MSIEPSKSDSKLNRRSSTGIPQLATATRKIKQNQNKKKDEDSNFSTTPRVSYRE